MSGRICFQFYIDLLPCHQDINIAKIIVMFIRLGMGARLKLLHKKMPYKQNTFYGTTVFRSALLLPVFSTEFICVMEIGWRRLVSEAAICQKAEIYICNIANSFLLSLSKWQERFRLRAISRWPTLWYTKLSKRCKPCQCWVLIGAGKALFWKDIALPHDHKPGFYP